jgi:hypothetical protein
MSKEIPRELRRGNLKDPRLLHKVPHAFLLAGNACFFKKSFVIIYTIEVLNHFQLHVGQMVKLYDNRGLLV